MKKSVAVIVLSILSVTIINGQSQFGSIAKFGLAVGFSPMWVFPNLDPINNQLTGFGVEPLPKAGMITWGGGGYAYVLFVKNLRIGGFGYGGSVSTTSNILGSINKKAEFHVGGGAFTAEYTLPFIKKFDFSIGIIIGGGSQEISIYKNNGNFSWNGIWSQTNADSSKTDSFSRILKNSFFTLGPTINIDYPLNRFMAFRFGGGYIFSIGNSWAVENEQRLSNVPTELNGNSFFIQTGIYIGFFAF